MVASTWREHVKQTSAENPEKLAAGGLKEILKLASATWKKGKGAVVGKSTTAKKHTAKHRRHRRRPATKRHPRRGTKHSRGSRHRRRGSRSRRR